MTLGTVGYGDVVPVTAVNSVVQRIERSPDRRDHEDVASPEGKCRLRHNAAGRARHSTYLIVDGEVEIKLRHEPVRLGAGHFFWRNRLASTYSPLGNGHCCPTHSPPRPGRG
nr:potassium channel family protein [Bradyrhizobium sp. WSM1743]